VAGEGLAQRRPAGAQLGAAAFTLPSCSARAKARSASARSIRKRLGCQPRWLCWDAADRTGRLVPGQFSSLVPVRLAACGVHGHGCAHMR
jgi:hypothetical protein